MKKLNNLSIALKGLGLTAESAQINKIAREYLSRVVSDNLSGKFYSTVRGLESELFSWSTDTFRVLLKDAYRRHPDTRIDVTKLSVQNCFADWCEEYASSIGSDDSGIPPWLFNFSEEKIFPILKESFSNCINNLPADSATKAGLQDWLSQTTISQMGSPNLASTLDGGAEFWSNIISNMVHEMHHNILNPSAWKRFSTLGNDETKYNLIDGLEEGLSATVLNLPNIKDNQKADSVLASVVANSMVPIIENIIPLLKRSYNYGEILVKNWSKIYDHLDQINLEEMGIKDSDQKMVFLKRVLDTAIDNNDLSTLSDRGEFSKILSLTVDDVWSEKTYGTNDYKWDFLTGDDETLLIELMKDLDSKADLILRTWEDYQSTSHKVALEATRDCIDKAIVDGLAELEE
jgi:hypothetical protein